jgi:hypothetical protein
MGVATDLEPRCLCLAKYRGYIFSGISLYLLFILNTKKITKLTQVFSEKTRAKVIDQDLDAFLVTPSDDNIIHVNN